MQPLHVRRTVAGEIVGLAAAQEEHAAELHVVHMQGSHFLVWGKWQHHVDREQRTCDCSVFKAGNVCAHLIAVQQHTANNTEAMMGIVPTNLLANK